MSNLEKNIVQGMFYTAIPRVEGRIDIAVADALVNAYIALDTPTFGKKAFSKLVFGNTDYQKLDNAFYVTPKTFEKMEQSMLFIQKSDTLILSHSFVQTLHEVRTAFENV